ncbi:hypothetical protein TNCV_394551 [Trichonephila clavipes]|nr:hypothetical protein TNCV_394551 [Trichonephila clavipes]
MTTKLKVDRLHLLVEEYLLPYKVLIYSRFMLPSENPESPNSPKIFVNLITRSPILSPRHQLGHKVANLALSQRFRQVPIESPL